MLYEKIAARQKDAKNKQIFLDIARAERGHYETWKGYTGEETSHPAARNRLVLLMSRAARRYVYIKFFEKSEDAGILICAPLNTNCRKRAPSLPRREENVNR